MLIRTASIAAAVAAVTIPVQAQTPPRTERVQFARGTSSVTLRGEIRGFASVDYLVGARAGQAVEISMRTSNDSAYFNVLPPRGEQAVFVGSSGGSRFTGRLSQTGDYRVRVYLMRNAARRGERANYSLTIAIRPAAGAAIPSRPGSGAPIPAGNMSAFCRGEASEMYAVRPMYIRTGPITRAPGGGSFIDGQADQGNRGTKRFRCRFDMRNRFIDVMAMSRDGE